MLAGRRLDESSVPDRHDHNVGQALVQQLLATVSCCVFLLALASAGISNARQNGNDGD